LYHELLQDSYLSRNVSHLSGIITLSNLKLNIDWHSVAICISLVLNNLIKNRLSVCVFRPSVRTDVRSCVCVRAFVMSTSLVKRSTNLRLLYCNYSAPDREAENCDERVRLCVCLPVQDHICTCDLHQIFMHVTHGRGSVLIWRQIRYVLPVLWMT